MLAISLVCCVERAKTRANSAASRLLLGQHMVEANRTTYVGIGEMMLNLSTNGAELWSQLMTGWRDSSGRIKGRGMNRNVVYR
jgi:hypothetical protein